MSNYVPTYTFSPNTLIQSGQVNTNFQGAATIINGQLDTSNLKAAANILGTQLSASASILGSQLSPTAGITAGQLAFSTSPVVNTGRLYGVSGNPYTDTSSSGTATVYYGPTYQGNYIALQSAGALVVQTFSEASISVAALGTGAYDVYASSASSTTVTLSTTAWTNATTPPTRGTDVAGRQTANGNAGALLVGAIYVLSNVAYNYTGRRLISNVYNRIALQGFAQDLTSSWSPSASGGFSSSNGNTTDGTGRINTFSVAALEPIKVYCQALFELGDGSADSNALGIGVNSTSTAIASVMTRTGGTTTSNIYQSIFTTYTASAIIGLTYFQRLDGYAGSNGVEFGVSPIYGSTTNITFMDCIIYG